MAEYEEQKKLKPSVDSLINILLSDTARDAALDFLSFLHDNKLTPQWGAKNSYNVKFKNKRICIIKINGNLFEIRAATQYNNSFIELYNSSSDSIKKFLLDGLTYCSACGTCKPGIDIEIGGKLYNNLCFNPVINIMNPNAEYSELAKKLILMRKKAIVDDVVPAITYISVLKR